VSDRPCRETGASEEPARRRAKELALYAAGTTVALGGVAALIALIVVAAMAVPFLGVAFPLTIGAVILALLALYVRQVIRRRRWHRRHRRGDEDRPPPIV